MEFKEGTHVYTSDGLDAGSIERVVLDPRTNDVAGLVVRSGWLFSEDKVMPISLVKSATAEGVRLVETEADLQDLPEFEAPYYIPAGEDDFHRGSDAAHLEAYPNPVYGYPPVGTAWWGYGAYTGYLPLDPEPGVVQRVEQNIPEGTVAVKKGARVLSLEGEHVGNVEEVFTDAATNHATHILISHGLLFKEHNLIPTNWLKLIGEDEVQLTVHTNVVQSLREYVGEKM